MHIDDAMREHARLMREISERDQEIAKLRDNAKLAREAIDRFCPPDLRGSAEKWLRRIGV